MKWIELIGRKHKKVDATLNYIENFVIILASTIIGCISICTFTSSLAIPIGVTSSAVPFKICAVAAAFKNC